MEIILLDKVANLGGLGDTVTVKSGYARNFLFPQQKAVPATKLNVDKFEQRRAELEAKIAEQLAAAQARADKLTALEPVTIASPAGDEGKLFGSVVLVISLMQLPLLVLQLLKQKLNYLLVHCVKQANSKSIFN